MFNNFVHECCDFGFSDLLKQSCQLFPVPESIDYVRSFFTIFSLKNNMLIFWIFHDFDDYSNCREIWPEELVDVCCYSQDILKQIIFDVANHDNSCLFLARLFLRLPFLYIIVSKIQRILGRVKFNMPIFNLAHEFLPAKRSDFVWIYFLSQKDLSRCT